MNTDSSYSDVDSTADYERTTLAAMFADRESAHDAINRLHEEGFRDTWLGITRTEDSAGYASMSNEGAETRVEADNWFARMFGEGDETLHAALIKHGVSEADAKSAGALPARSAIVTVDGANHPELAAQIVSQNGGKLITGGFGATGYKTAGSYSPPATGSFASSAGLAATGGLAGGAIASGMTTPGGAYDVSAEAAPLAGASIGSVSNTTSDRYATDVPVSSAFGVDASDDYGAYRSGQTIDEPTRIQLREERLRIDTERRSRGAATISKDIVTQTQSVDVPLIHEELFIERRPVSSTTASTGAPIGTDSEVISIPLTEETLNVSKVAVVTEEVVVGKREVEEVQHVTETTRKEELNVVDVDGGSASTTGVSTGYGTTDPRI